MNEIISKIGKVEQLELFPADEFADTPDETLAEWINAGHAAIKMAVRRLAIHVAQVGAWLVAARAKCQHGEWLNWLVQNCPQISQRTAYNYIEIYDELKDANLQLVANLTPTQAYRLVGIIKEDKPQVENTADRSDVGYDNEGVAGAKWQNIFPKPYYKANDSILYHGNALDVLRRLPDESINCVITSPPYLGLRDFGEETEVDWDDGWRGQLGNEPSVEIFLSHLLQIFSEVKRVLRPDGTCFVELGDTYGGSGGSAEKSLLCVPFRFAIGMTDMGWLLRNTIVIWKRSCVPCSSQDRFTVDFSYLFFFTKSRNYWFQQQFEQLASGKGLRNTRAVWDITSQGLHEDHYAPFSETLVEIPISAGCPEFVCKICDKPRKLVVKKEYLVAHEKHGAKYQKLVNLTWGPIVAGCNIADISYDNCDCVAEDKWRPGIVLDPFMGSGTTGVVAIKQDKKFIGIELNEKYIKDIAIPRLRTTALSNV